MFRLTNLIVLPAMMCVSTAAFAADAAKPGEQPNVMSGSIYQAIAAIIAFVALLIILRMFAWGPLLKGLQDRENKIKSDLEAAETAAKDAKATLEEYKTQLAEAQAEARNIIDTAVKDADAARQRLVSQTEEDITKAHARAANEINLAKDKAIQELYAQTAVLATSVAEKILKRQIEDQDTQQLVEQSLKELEQLN